MPEPRPARQAPADVLAALVAADPGVPRLTCYDDTPGPTQGERVELSARVLANWVAKAANLLQDELDAAPATTVGLALPAHWRAVYWALAAWSVGSTVVLGERTREADVVVSDEAGLTAEVAADARLAVLVALPMLARGRTDTPADVVDESRELASYADVFVPWEEPSSDAAALAEHGVDVPYPDVVVARPDWGPAPRIRVADDLSRLLTDGLSAWAAGGSVVLVRSPQGDQSARLASEGVTRDLS